jgi:hypothetical protein
MSWNPSPVCRPGQMITYIDRTEFIAVLAGAGAAFLRVYGASGSFLHTLVDRASRYGLIPCIDCPLCASNSTRMDGRRTRKSSYLSRSDHSFLRAIRAVV